MGFSRQEYRSGEPLPSVASIHGIFQARIPEWVVMLSSRGSSWPTDWTRVSCISCTAGRFFTHWATWEALFVCYLQLNISRMTEHDRKDKSLRDNLIQFSSWTEQKTMLRDGEGVVQVTKKTVSRAEGQNFCLPGLNGNLRNPSLALLFVHIPSMRRSQWITRTFRKCTFSLHFPCTETSGTSGKKSEMSQVSCCHWHWENKKSLKQSHVLAYANGPGFERH